VADRSVPSSCSDEFLVVSSALDLSVTHQAQARDVFGLQGANVAIGCNLSNYTEAARNCIHIIDDRSLRAVRKICASKNHRGRQQLDLNFISLSVRETQST
jgi:hypothetical protein